MNTTREKQNYESPKVDIIHFDLKNTIADSAGARGAAYWEEVGQ